MQQTILIIEDDADIAEGLHYNLKREGFRPVVAESGEKGLRLALDEKNTPSLIMLDLMLPGMSGMELCRRLRREGLSAHRTARLQPENLQRLIGDREIDLMVVFCRLLQKTQRIHRAAGACDGHHQSSGRGCRFR